MNHSGATGVPRGGGLRRGHWVVLGAIALCLVLVGGVLLYLSPVLALLDNHDLSPAKPVATPAATPPPLDSKQRVNILLLGSDNDEKFAQNAVLSQTMIVVSIDPAKRQVTLLSLPRDLWVAIPGHASAKIDLAYAEGGAPLARATVEKVFRIPIHYYAGMDLVTALPSFARDLNGHVKTDLDLVRLTQLMLFMRGLHAGDVHQAFITPFVRDAVSPDGQQILQADWRAVNAYLRQLFGGDLLP